MLSDEALQASLLEFRHKSFAYERKISVGGEPLAVFGRTETETESKFRPRLVHLFLFVPVEWIRTDPATEDLLIQRSGGPPAAAPPGSADAQEIAAEAAEFSEAGVDWSRVQPKPDRVLYVPRERAPALSSDPAVRALVAEPR
jgi:hypothetical protein